jgi:hypothetical protein
VQAAAEAESTQLTVVQAVLLVAAVAQGLRLTAQLDQQIQVAAAAAVAIRETFLVVLAGRA